MRPKAVSVIGVLAIVLGWWLYRREHFTIHQAVPTAHSLIGNLKQRFVDSIDPGMIIAPGRAVDRGMVVSPDRNVDPKMVIEPKASSTSGLQKYTS